MYDLLIKNIDVVDGSGKPRFKGNVAVKNEKIHFASNFEGALKVIDGDGLCLCPGFIDSHSHGDQVFGEEYGMLCKTAQGITTQLVGQCGASIFPVSDNPYKRDLHMGFIDLSADIYGRDNVSGFTSFKAYLDYVKTVLQTTNFLQLVGHGALRIAAMGFDERPATAVELETMRHLLDDAMAEGALGMSSGLIYSPSCYASQEEISYLCKTVAAYDGVYTTHMRDEAAGVIASVKESIDTAITAGVRLNISHHKVCGRDNCGLSKNTLAMMEEASNKLPDLWTDFYPYTASFTHLNVCIPKEAFKNGPEAMKNALKEPEIRNIYEAKMITTDGRFRQCGGGKGIYIAIAPQMPEAEGKYLSEYAAIIGKNDAQALFDIVAACGSAAYAIYFSMCDEDLCRIAASPLSVVGSDGLVYSRNGMTHPRGYNAFPQAIDYIWRRQGLMSFEEAIAKATSIPAKHLGLESKGLISEGFDADMLLLDLEHFEPGGSYTNPTVLPRGIEAVINGGQIVYKNGQLTGNTPGKFIPNPRKKHNKSY